MGDLSNHFNRSEFECNCGCGFDTADYELVLVLEDLRAHFGKPVRSNSACRCLDYNKAVGGVDNSYHTKSMASDTTVDGVEPDRVYEYLNNKYFNKYGIGRYNTFTHIDVRPNKARWDNRTNG